MTVSDARSFAEPGANSGIREAPEDGRAARNHKINPSADTDSSLARCFEIILGIEKQDFLGAAGRAATAIGGIFPEELTLSLPRPVVQGRCRFAPRHATALGHIRSATALPTSNALISRAVVAARTPRSIRSRVTPHDEERISRRERPRGHNAGPQLVA